jgi:Fuc2NAc and GlcNAc transferase
MSTFGINALCAGTMLASWAVTGALRSYALQRGMLDVPNERSSHVEPTPRGGGAAIVVATLGAMCMLALAGMTTWTLVLGFGAAGVVVAIAGFVDDRKHLKRRWRLLAHFGGALILLISMSALGPIALLGGMLSGWAMFPIAILYIVWLINLTNFMDGIDGLAASEAVCVSIGGALLYAIATSRPDASAIPLVFAAAAGGFLIWNRPPARIFMGDVGSGFVGIALAAMSLHASTVSTSLFSGWVILLGVFVVDASVTLIRRILRAERVWDAHRMHAYQHAALRWHTHRGVTLAVVGINIFWLLPVAAFVALRRIDEVTGLVVAYSPLVAGAVWLGAGAPSSAASPQTRSPRRSSTGEKVGR